MNKKLKAASVAVAATMLCGIFAGCSLVTTNERKNMEQVIAEVNITSSAHFNSEFGEGSAAKYGEVISTAEISKRDMIVMFVGAGYNAMTNYGWTYKDTFKAISESLYQREIYLQYAKVYFLKNGGYEDCADTEDARLAAYKQAIDGKTGIERDIASCKAILSDTEEKKADYTTRSMFNNSIDSQEKSIIQDANDDVKYESDVRTTPTGLDTANEDYVPTPESYAVYTGTGKQARIPSAYETVKGSTPTTRKKAYNAFIANLKTNDLIENGEDTSDVESLSYFKLEQKSDYEDALIQKLTETFTKQAEAKLTEKYCNDYFTTLLNNQRDNYSQTVSSMESAMDSVSDTSFVLTSPTNEDQNYGFVINILLPFSTSQSEKLKAADKDFGDTQGNKFAYRAKLLQKIEATDQRGSWFTGETDYSFAAQESDHAYGFGTDRKWLFFEDNVKNADKYEPLKNYYGKYTYNGTYNPDKRIYEPNKISIDGFMSEMEGYLGAAGYSMTKEKDADYCTNYYNRPYSYYYNDKVVEYDKFIYQCGKVSFDNNNTADVTETYNPNEIFKAGSAANDVMSVIRELSFAYNTDTAGLNSYFGYAVTANKTDFVPEFEYAAQLAVKNGAGSYVVAPSDYGWHVIYCTFSYANSAAVGTTGINSPYAFDYSKREEKGTFSYLFYEAIKADTATSDATARRSKVVNAYLDCYTLYEDRYADLSELDDTGSSKK